MVEVDTTEQRVYACLLVHGAPVFVRFDTEDDYRRFAHAADVGGDLLKPVTGFDNGDLLVRPASVDLILKGAKPDGK